MCWQAPDSGVIGIICYDTYVVSIDSILTKFGYLPHLINERRQFFQTTINVNILLVKILQSSITKNLAFPGR